MQCRRVQGGAGQGVHMPKLVSCPHCTYPPQSVLQNQKQEMQKSGVPTNASNHLR